ncbi:hypothetical protein D9619_009668 [Psilocybe cf. subviscida]|uniref:Uncharacterized protein n=1 Tax=Psilocybe cf. subviscida TaxID=2480587 RepID=A0A8H5BKW3_9AGAR|nr:hypothetical protein D9619_009668 [Psilocybe cf. subviscida]
MTTSTLLGSLSKLRDCFLLLSTPSTLNMSLPHPIIVFGPTPGTYFVGVGMKYYAVGMPDSITSTASKWPAVQMRWMSINADGAWMVQDMYSSTLEFDTSVGDDLIQQCRGTNGFQYVTFGPTRGTWVGVGPDSSGVWSGNMEDDQIRALREMQAQAGDGFNFNMELRGILFGKGSTMIFMFGGSFAYYTDREAEGSELENLLNSYLYRSPAWTVERGSSLCPWDVNYYFLRFKDPQSGTVKMHWSLPPNMLANFNALSAWVCLSEWNRLHKFYDFYVNAHFFKQSALILCAAVTNECGLFKEVHEMNVCGILTHSDKHTWAQTPEAQAAIAQNQQLGLALAMNTMNLNIQAANALKISTGWYSYGPY